MTDQEYIVCLQFDRYIRNALANRNIDLIRKARKQTENETYLEDYSEYELNRLLSERNGNDRMSVGHRLQEETLWNQELYDAIESLSEDYQDPIEYYYRYGFNDIEIAQILNLSRKKVNRIRKKAVETIRKYLQEHRDDKEE